MSVAEQRVGSSSIAAAGLARIDSMPRGLTKLSSETWVLYVRHMKRLSRQSTVIFFSLIQPLIWLILFGQMFSRIARFPGSADDFGNVSYLQFFIPTVVLQSILFGSGQSGVGIITDIDSGFLDKLMTTPINRLAILMGRLTGDLTRMVVQMTLVIVIGFAIGQFQDPKLSFYYGIPGILGALCIAMLFALALMGLNVYIALRTRSTEATFIISNFLTLPLLFTSSAQLPIALLPEWMQTLAHLNPVTYAIEAMRVLLNGPDAASTGHPGLAVLEGVVILTGLSIVTLGIATRRFRSVVS